MNDIYRVENSKTVFKESHSTTINNLKIGFINLQNSHMSMKNTYEIEVLPKIDDLISKINKELH
jgi:hypothetical protein